MDTRSLVWTPGKRSRLRDVDPADTNGYAGKHEARDKLRADIKKLSKLQDVLSAGAEHGILIIFQGMDSAGKDSAVKHVMSGVNPQGIDVHSFRQPTEEERRHDYLWRCARVLPERGRMGIFNRSYFEEVLIVRVHPELLGPRLAAGASSAFWKRRYRDINGFERYLVDNRIHVLKFFLYISKEEQAKRLLARLERPDKYWKFSAADLQQRKYWPAYMKAYEDMLNATSTPWAPWNVIPADHKWFAHVAIADIIVRELRSLKLAYPSLPSGLRKALRAAKRKLEKG
ncbi:MAG TPA: polyphosphate kinase 2 family protein [Candidatus Eremiobacteraceae bacterium]|nr:polyphosphate kinase 2 family protein [Candidatus Eremiobacteraceae bacterium]